MRLRARGRGHDGGRWIGDGLGLDVLRGEFWEMDTRVRGPVRLVFYLVQRISMSEFLYLRLGPKREEKATNLAPRQRKKYMSPESVPMPTTIASIHFHGKLRATHHAPNRPKRKMTQLPVNAVLY